MDELGTALGIGKLIASIGAGGPAAWIAMGVAGLGLGVLFFLIKRWWKKKLGKIARDKSNKLRVEDQSNLAKENDKISKQLKKDEQKTDDQIAEGVHSGNGQDPDSD